MFLLMPSPLLIISVLLSEDLNTQLSTQGAIGLIKWHIYSTRVLNLTYNYNTSTYIITYSSSSPFILWFFLKILIPKLIQLFWAFLLPRKKLLFSCFSRSTLVSNDFSLKIIFMDFIVRWSMNLNVHWSPISNNTLHWKDHWQLLTYSWDCFLHNHWKLIPPNINENTVYM